MNINGTLSDFLNEIDEKYDLMDAYRWYEGNLFYSRSYHDLNTDSRRIASFLDKKFNKGTHIALFGETSYSWITAYFGVMLCGDVSIPMDVKLDNNAIASRLKAADATVIFISDRYFYLSDILRRKCPFLKEILNIDELLSLSEGYDEKYETDIDYNALAQIMFTSGTTGAGKGVMLSHRNIMYVTHGRNSLCSPGDRLLSVLPIHHCFELFYTQLSYLLQGAVVCVNDSIENIIPNMNRFGIHILITVPMLANRFAELINQKESDMTPEQIRNIFGGYFKLIGIGGAAARPDVIDTMHRIGVNVFSGYGLTEGTGGCIVNPIDSIRHESIGIPFIEGLEVSIINEELCMKGPTVMLGYYNDRAETEKTIVDGWLHTGDLGYIKDGYIYLNGRKNNKIVTSNGENVYPEELEEYIKKIPGVIEAVVYNHNDCICAGIQIDDLDNEESVQTGINNLNKTLPSYKKISILSFQRDSFPVTTSMKVKRNEAIKCISDLLKSSQNDHIEKNITVRDRDTQNETLKSICNAYASALRIERFDENLNFFEKGGDSFAALEVASKLSNILDNITPNDIYINPVPLMLYRYFFGEIEKTESIKKPDINRLIGIRREMPVGLGNVFLTGATGFLGNHVLKELIEKGYQVTCLIRNENKFKKVCSYYFPDSDFSGVRLIQGDITKENLGLSQNEYQELSLWTDSVFHIAADVRHSGFESEIHNTNVLGTEKVIEFSINANAKLFHTSSFAVAGFGTKKSLTENTLDIGQQISQNVYIKSKYQAEEQVLLAREKGIHTSIMRMGYITWRKDGVFQLNEDDNGLTSQLKAFRKLGMYPKEIEDLSYDFSSVDESAKAFVILAESSAKDSIWHVINPHRLKISQLGIGKQVSMDIFTDNLNRNNNDRDVIILSMYMQMIKRGINGNIDVNKTVERLSELGFQWSEANPDLMAHIRVF